MIFDGVDQSASWFGKGPSNRNNFVYFEDQNYGGFRLNQFKTLYTQRDTWLGYKKDMNIPALYNLQWDPQEQHNLFFSASSGERMWQVIYMNDTVMTPFLKEITEVPNRVPAGIGGYITKHSTELLMKSTLLEEAMKKMVTESKDKTQK